jgi:2-oxoglutarate ferredoxin oxidoreductase subunit beta
MDVTLEHPNLKYLRKGAAPHMFCPGCACGQILNYFVYAIDELGLDPDKIVTIGGVGCTARIPAYLNTDAIHGIHGRTLGFATGVKLTNPELKVIIMTGDGDVAAIGGNHLIQAARRNLDVTLIVNNNGSYAMTGGQVSPVTPTGATTTTTTRGNLETPFDLCKLVEAAGGTYISRWTTAHSAQLINAIKEGIRHKGFSFIEVVGQCPTIFGRYCLGLREPVENLNWLKNNSIPKSQAEKMKTDELEGKIIIGNFVKKEVPTLDDRYKTLESKVQSRR